jgi:hypothetical protein
VAAVLQLEIAGVHPRCRSLLADSAELTLLRSNVEMVMNFYHCLPVEAVRAEVERAKAASAQRALATEAANDVSAPHC